MSKDKLKRLVATMPHGVLDKECRLAYPQAKICKLGDPGICHRCRLKAALREEATVNAPRPPAPPRSLAAAVHWINNIYRPWYERQLLVSEQKG